MITTETRAPETERALFVGRAVQVRLTVTGHDWKPGVITRLSKSVAHDARYSVVTIESEGRSVSSLAVASTGESDHFRFIPERKTTQL